MKLELNTNLVPIFNGTYGGIFDFMEWIDHEYELFEDEPDYQDIIKRIDNIKHEDYIRAIFDCYNDNIDYINSELQFIKIIKFTGTSSPREYNFSTDTLDFIANVDVKGMLKYLKDNQNNEKLKDYLYDKFTSHDGFVSFTPNNIEDITHEIKTKGKEYEQAISAILNYINANVLLGIEIYVYDEFRSNRHVEY